MIINFLLLIKLSFALLQPSIENTYFQNECVCNSGSDEDIKKAIQKSIDFIEKARSEELIPGVVAGISIKGKDIMTEAFGQTDIENDVKTYKVSVWRLGSISKSLTTLMIGRLIEKGIIGLEKSIYDYLSPKIFAIKQWNNKNVTITVKKVMSHTAGLRVTKIRDDFKNIYNLKNVIQNEELFKDESLIFELGIKFKYSNYGFQIIGAIIESVLNETYIYSKDNEIMSDSAMTKPVWVLSEAYQVFNKRFCKIFSMDKIDRIYIENNVPEI